MSQYISDKSYQMTAITEPGQNDVMCGRGGGTNNHVGNRRFRMLVNTHKSRYYKAPKLDKPKVAREVMILWREQDPPGRFLGKDPKTSAWNDVGDQKSREKASQCLRERRVTGDNKSMFKSESAPTTTSSINDDGDNSSSSSEESSEYEGGKKKKTKRMTPSNSTEDFTQKKHDFEAFEHEQQPHNKKVAVEQNEDDMNVESGSNNNPITNGSSEGLGNMIPPLSNNSDAITLQQQILIQQQRMLQQQQQRSVYQNLMQQLQMLQQGGGVGGVMPGMGGIMPGMGTMGGLSTGMNLQNNSTAMDVNNMILMQNMMQQQRGGLGMMGMMGGMGSTSAMDRSAMSMNLLQNQLLRGQAQTNPLMGMMGQNTALNSAMNPIANDLKTMREQMLNNAMLASSQTSMGSSTTTALLTQQLLLQQQQLKQAQTIKVQPPAASPPQTVPGSSRSVSTATSDGMASADWMKSLKSITSQQSDTFSKIIGSDTGSIRNILKFASAENSSPPQSQQMNTVKQQAEMQGSSDLPQVPQEPKYSIDQIVQIDKYKKVEAQASSQKDNMSLLSKDSGNKSNTRQKAMLMNRNASVRSKASHSLMSDISVLSDGLISLNLSTNN
mmetsp:Transcript_48773/g.56983  ORF Transcript_48773/g.56983 Transcript_48773/m.56983 type:complete len:610 (+) Transcript_48773:178-2007(+)